MKKILLFGLVLFAGTIVQGQPSKKKSNYRETGNTLLWKISGNGLSKPSFLFGTMHLLCADDIILSDSLTRAIKNADNVYLELDMDNFMEMMNAMTHMTMRNDTTLADLLSKEDYEKVKKYFEENSSILPFSLLETYKPLLATSLIMQQKGSPGCTNMISMEQLVMKEAKIQGVKIKGIESMMYQVSIFDSIPYKFQAEQLVKIIDEGEKADDGKEMKLITDAYRQQDLSVMEEMTKKADMGIENFTDLLLYNRNRIWAEKLKILMNDKSLVVAVGAGHLPGEKGLINLLKKAGYKVEPVKNEMIRKKTKEI
jgi:uncharacterized protein